MNCIYHRFNKVDCADPIEADCVYTQLLVFINVVHERTNKRSLWRNNQLLGEVRGRQRTDFDWCIVNPLTT